MDIYDKCFNNIKTIESIINDPEASKTYLSLHRMIKQIWFDLRYFLIHASKLSVNNDYHEFPVSVRHLEKQFGGKYNTWNRNISVFVTIGLIKRISHNESVISLNADDYNQLTPVNVYQIPYYDAAVLEEADKLAKIMYDHYYHLKSFSKTFVIKTFGQEYANTVYPDKRAITKQTEYVTVQITNRILKDIKERGYTTKRRVIAKTFLNLEKVTSQEYGIHNHNRRNILTTGFNNSIKDICNTHGLRYGRANKAIMERFHLKTAIWIICKDE